jgi:hypothetical protein
MLFLIITYKDDPNFFYNEDSCKNRAQKSLEKFHRHDLLPAHCFYKANILLISVSLNVRRPTPGNRLFRSSLMGVGQTTRSLKIVTRC